MAAPPVCRSCGSVLPRTAILCPRCGQPVFVLTGRRSRQRRNAAVVGMAGSILMASQSACMLIGGSIALLALNAATRGELDNARAIAGNAAIYVGLALLFDLVGIALLIVSFHLFTRTARAGATLAVADPERRAFVKQGSLATICLTLWLLVTLVWRGALVALVSFYPTPFGRSVAPVSGGELREAASVMLGLWALAAIILFLGAVFGTRFLMQARGATLTVPRLLWPLETLVHASAAIAILVVAPGLLANLRIEVSTLAIIQVLGALDLIVVPVLGVLAYVYLFRDFFRLHGGSEQPAAPAPPRPASADPPAGEP